MLLNDLQQQTDYLKYLLELFLAYFCKNGSIKEFVEIHIDEAIKHLDKVLIVDQQQKWWDEMGVSKQKNHKRTKRIRYFKNLSNGTKQLYFLFRNSLKLQSNKFLQKEYPHLCLDDYKYQIIRAAANSVKREDYFLIESTSLAYQDPDKRGFPTWLLINVLSESVSTFQALDTVVDLKKEKGEHILIKYIEDKLRRNISSFKKFNNKHMIPSIVQMLLEYYARDNPFECSLPAMALDHSTSSLLDTALVSDMESKFAITDNDHVVNVVKANQSSLQTIEQQHIQFASSSKSTSTAPSQNNEKERKLRLQQRIKALFGADLNPVIVKPTTIPEIPSTSSSSSIVSAIPRKPGKPGKVGPISFIAQMLKDGKVPRKEALQFFYSKKLQFDGMEDCIVNNDGLRHYVVKGNSNSNEDNYLAAAVLTCILHAIRLLFVDRLLPESDVRQYQELLTTMASKMRSWTLDEVLKGLKLEDSLPEINHATTNRFKSFVEKVRDVHTGFFTVLPTIPWAQFSNLESQQLTVEGLYYGSATTEGDRDRMNHIFFLSFADSPPPNLPLPYLFHCRRGSGDTYTEKSDGTCDLCDDSLDKNSTTLQLVGLIYRDEKGEYSFTMITYARCIDLGQYQVFTKEQTASNMDRLFPVPFREKDSDSNAPKPVFTSDGAGRQVVGLVLVRNHNQSGQKDTRFLTQPVLRTIYDNCSYSCSAKNDSSSGGKLGKSHCEIRTSILKALDSSTTWLQDETVNGTVFLMCDHLKATHGLKSNNAFYICTSLSFNCYVESSRPSKNFLLDVKGCVYSLFIINITNSHWVCACAPMNGANKKIYFLDSMNKKATAKAKGKILIEFFEKKLGLPGYEAVLLPSSDQIDGCNCGLFTILNATIFLKSIFEGCFDPDGLLRRKPRAFTDAEKRAMRLSVRSALHGTETVGSLLKWV